MRLKAMMDWLIALLITAAVAVTVLGVSESVEQVRTGEVDTPYGRIIPVTADGFTVVLDAGHGGQDGGAIGNDTGVAEAGLNLAVAKLVQSKLLAEGVNVIMTRTDEKALDDTKRKDMAERRRVLRSEGVDIVVSIHMNKFNDRSIRGAMAYYMKGSADGQALAACVIDSLCTDLSQKKRDPNPGDYFVLRECSAPAVLVECGFLSNAEEELLLADAAYQQKLASAITAGVMTYLKARAAA